ncbi:uncharacterized protein LOC143291527 [Babylonia areolata]|uniref:uncharacterized protein LOC143291527 n=1 Tax=Babylonia areolata TaxID=304850 RepID=UPI003FD5F0E7
MEEEVLNKDAFIGFFILLLVIAVLVNLTLLVTLLYPFGRHADVIWPFRKLVAPCRGGVGVGEGGRGRVTPKHWLMALCCLCHLLTACLHHAFLAHLFRSRDGYLPPPASCSALVLTELSAFLFPTLSRLLVAALAVTEVLDMMTSVRDVRRVTCVLVVGAGVYAFGVLVPVFFGLYLESAARPCYEGEAVLRYTASGSEGRAMPVLSYIVPVVVIIAAVVAMIVMHNVRQTSASFTNVTVSSAGAFSRSSSDGARDVNNGNDDDCRRYNNRQTDVRAAGEGVQYRKSWKSGMSRQNCRSEPGSVAKPVSSFPWDTLVVCVLVVVLEFVFCVRQWAYWDQADHRLMSTSQWVQLWAADRVLSLLCLVLVPCCWFRDPRVRQVFLRRHDNNAPGSGTRSKQEEGAEGKVRTPHEFVNTSGQSETRSGEVHRNKLNDSGTESYENDRKNFVDNNGRERYQNDRNIFDDNNGRQSYQNSRNIFDDNNGRESYRKALAVVSDNYYKANRPSASVPMKELNQTTVVTRQGNLYHNDRRDSANRSGTERQHNQNHNCPKATAQEVYSLHRYGASAPNILSGDSTAHNKVFNRNRSCPTVSGEGALHVVTGLDSNGSDVTDHVYNGSDVTDHVYNGSDVTDHAYNGSDVTDHAYNGSDVKQTGSQHRQGEWTNDSATRTDWRQPIHNNQTKTGDDTASDNKNSPTRPAKRDVYRWTQRNKQDFLPDDRRRNQPSDNPRSEAVNTHPARDQDWSPQQPNTPSTRSKTAPRNRQNITYNSSYKPAEDLPQNQYHPQHRTSQNRDISRGAEETSVDVFPHLTQPEGRLTLPFHQSPASVQMMLGESRRSREQFHPQRRNPAREGERQVTANGELTQGRGRWGVPQTQRVTKREEFTHRHQGGESSREKEDTTQRREFIHKQGTSEQTGATERWRATDREGFIQTEMITQRQADLKRRDIPELRGMPETRSPAQDPGRSASHTAHIPHQGHQRYNTLTTGQNERHSQYHRSDEDGNEDRLGYKNFSGNLNQDRLERKGSAEHQGQGYKNYLGDQVQAGLGYDRFFQDQGQGHPGYRDQGQGQGQGRRAVWQGGRGGGQEEFHAPGRRRDADPYNPESEC